jgi:hypothetical protein
MNRFAGVADQGPRCPERIETGKVNIQYGMVDLGQSDLALFVGGCGGTTSIECKEAA